MKWFHSDKNDNNEDFMQMEQQTKVVMERRLLVSKHSWRSEKGFDGSKYKRNVALCSYLC